MVKFLAVFIPVFLVLLIVALWASRTSRRVESRQREWETNHQGELIPWERLSAYDD